MKRLHNIIAGAAALVLALTLCVTAFGDSASYDDMAAAIASAQKIQLGIAETDPLLTPSRGKLCVRLDSPCHGPRRCCR